MISNAFGRRSNRIERTSGAVLLKSVLVVLSLVALCAPTTDAVASPFLVEAGSGTTRTTFNLSGGFAAGTTLTSINGVDQYGRIYGSVTTGASTYGFLGSYLGNGLISNAGPLGILPAGASSSSFSGIYSSGNMTYLPGSFTDGSGSHPFIFEPGSGTTRTTFNLSGGFALGTTLSSINGVDQYGRFYGSVTSGASTYGFIGNYLGNGQIINAGPLGLLPAGASKSSFSGIYSSGNMTYLPGSFTDGSGSHPFIFEPGSGTTRTTFNLSGGFAPGTTLASINGIDQYGHLYGSVTTGASTYGFVGSYLGNGQISNAGPLGILPAGASKSSFSGIYSWGGMTILTGNYTIAAVPEPETYVMLLAGLAIIGAAFRRR